MNNFFIIGAQRSGTTLLRLILNSHSQIAIPEEGTFWMPLLRRYGVNPHKKFSKKELDNCLKYISSNSQFKLWNIPCDELIDKINYHSCQDLLSLMQIVYSMYSEKHHKAIWADKTPSFFRMVPELSRLFPEAKFIHIIRDGRDLYLSWRKIDPGKSNIAVCALEWCHKVCTAQKDLLKFRNSNHLEIRYEDLVQDPKKILNSICLFLNIKFEAEMLNFWQQSEKYIGCHHSELIFKPLSTHSINKWKKELSDNELQVFENIAGDCLRNNGFETSSNRHYWQFATYLKLSYGLPFRAIQVLCTAIKLNVASRFGIGTTASGGK